MEFGIGKNRKFLCILGRNFLIETLFKTRLVKPRKGHHVGSARGEAARVPEQQVWVPGPSPRGNRKHKLHSFDLTLDRNVPKLGPATHLRG